ncbi:MAG TPA: hypothetical protein VFA59_22040 [Vicinamibacterales bacterium]|nr:hypothetical protein [Vicinamibacterales bacterium]
MPTQIGANRLELFTVPAALIGVMFVVMWIEAPGPNCVISTEASRVLVLSRAEDREHLTADLASADRAARRYMLATDNRDQQQMRFVECEATLVADIATRHRLSTDQVRASWIGASSLRQPAQWR